MRAVVSAATATTRVEVDCRTFQDLLVQHYIIAGSTGAYTSFNDRPASIADQTGKPIASAVRDTNVVTITTHGAHGFAVGQTAVISGVTTATFDGTFTIATVPSTTTFTYAQTAADVTSFQGTAKGGWQLLHAATSGDAGGYNIPNAANQTASYRCIVKNVSPWVEVVCNVNATNGGTNYVFVEPSGLRR